MEIKVWLHDREGRREFVIIDEGDTIRVLKEKAVQKMKLGTAHNIRIQKWYDTYEDDKTLKYYKIQEGTRLVISYDRH